ncbi:MBL fold metallo-hydrolase [Bartonella sp. LJL80]
MMDHYKFTILGCGSSPGVPRPNGDWGDCDPSNAKNRRFRTSLLVERISVSGSKTTIVIDTGPDFRSQMIRANVQLLDGVVYTHAHADHIHGIDDLRSYVIGQKRLMDIYADHATFARLEEAFGYCFKTPEGSSYPPILQHHTISPNDEFFIEGKGGRVSMLPLLQIHGDIHSLGFRIGNVAYCTDVSDFPAFTPPLLQDLDVLIIGALQYRPHPSHFSLDQALEWVERLRPKRAILTHMHVPLDYDAVMAYTPDHVEPAFQGMQFDVHIS